VGVHEVRHGCFFVLFFAAKKKKEMLDSVSKHDEQFCLSAFAWFGW